MAEEDKKLRIIRIIFIVIGIVLVVAFIFGLITTSKTDDEAGGASGYIVEKASYTFPDSEVTSRLPSIKLNSDDAKAVNEELNNLYNQAIRSGMMQFTYQYSIGSKYLSVLAIINSIDTDGYPYSKFETYNFDIQTGKRLSTGELYQLFSKNLIQAATSFETVMRQYYEQEVESMYFTKEECDYQCFLKLRGITNYSDNIQLFLQNDELKFYRAFKVFSKYGEEQFYRNEDFLFDF